MQNIYTDNEQVHNIKESKKIFKKAQKNKSTLSSSDAEFINMTRNTSMIDMLFSMPVRAD